MLLNVMRILSIAILISIIFLSNGCNDNSVCSQKEISRKSSPDKIVDALVVQENCGATTSYSYKVYRMYSFVIIKPNITIHCINDRLMINKA